MHFPLRNILMKTVLAESNAEYGNALSIAHESKRTAANPHLTRMLADLADISAPLPYPNVPCSQWVEFMFECPNSPTVFFLVGVSIDRVNYNFADTCEMTTCYAEVRGEMIEGVFHTKKVRSLSFSPIALKAYAHESGKLAVKEVAQVDKSNFHQTVARDLEHCHMALTLLQEQYAQAEAMPSILDKLPVWLTQPVK